MIITRRKSSDELLRILDGKKNIFIVGCGDCAATCKTGGADEVVAFAKFLESQGKAVTGFTVPDVTCASAQAKIAFAKNKKALKISDAVVVLACGSGVQCIKDNDRLDLDVYPGCDSLHAALISPDGSFKKVCSSCGECLLALTEGICPVTRCAKGLLNGPCGGQDQGKCEVDRTRDCAWILIYKRLRDKGRLDRMRRHQPAKKHNVTT